MKRLLFFFMFFMAFSAFAQSGNVLDKMDSGFSGILFRNKVMDKKADKVTGSPYLEDIFMSSSISGVENIFLTRYNAYKDEVEVSYDEETFLLPKDTRYETIWNKKSNYKLQLVNYISDKEENIYGYLIDLFSNEKVGFFKREQIILQVGRQPENSYAPSVPPKYNRKSSQFYLKVDTTKIVPFPRNKKALIEIYPESKEKITKYLKENRTSFKKEEDLIALTKFLGSL